MMVHSLFSCGLIWCHSSPGGNGGASNGAMARERPGGPGAGAFDLLVRLQNRLEGRLRVDIKIPLTTITIIPIIKPYIEIIGFGT